MPGMDQIDQLSGALGRYTRVRDKLTTTSFKTPSGVVETASYRCLFALLDTPMRSGALAEYLYADPSTVSRHVASLVQAGLIRREADPDDGRATRLVVTDEGREKIDDVKQSKFRVFSEILSDFSDDDVADLISLMNRLVDNAERVATRVAHHPDLVGPAR